MPPEIPLPAAVLMALGLQGCCMPGLELTPPTHPCLSFVPMPDTDDTDQPAPMLPPCLSPLPPPVGPCLKPLPPPDPPPMPPPVGPFLSPPRPPKPPPIGPCLTPLPPDDPPPPMRPCLSIAPPPPPVQPCLSEVAPPVSPSDREQAALAPTPSDHVLDALPHDVRRRLQARREDR